MATSKQSKPKTKKAEVKTTEEKPVIKVSNGIVNCNKLNVRKAASTNAEIISVISKGDKVQLYPDTKGKFFEVITADGKHGYCVKEFITVK